MKFIAFLNKDHALKLTLQDLAQIAFRMGPRVSGVPDVNVLFGTTKQVYEFQKRAADLACAAPHHTLFSEHAPMSLEKNTASFFSSPSSPMVLSTGLLSTDIEPKLREIMADGFQLDGYEPYVSPYQAKLINTHQDTPNESFLIVTLFSQLPLPQMINALILTHFQLGQTIHNDIQCNLNEPPSTHTHMLLETSTSHHQVMAKNARTSPLRLYAHTHYNSHKTPLVTAAGGTKDAVHAVILEKATQPFNRHLTPLDARQKTLAIF